MATKTPSKRIIVDLGNGYTKMINAKGELSVTPSMVSHVTDAAKYPHCDIYELTKSAATGYLPSNTWICGDDARQFAPKSLVRVGEYSRSEGKALLALNLIIPQLEPKDADYEIVASVPDVNVQGEELKKNLLGSHTIRHNGKTFTIRIRNVIVKSEGYGAAYFAIANGKAPKGKNTATYDIGDGTFILSVFTPKGQEIDELRTVLPEGGCNALYTAIAEHSDIKRLFNGAIKAEYVERALREMLETGSNQLLIDTYDATELYKTLKSIWLTKLHNAAKSTLKPMLSELGAIVAFGGGVGYVADEIKQLPKVTVLDDYQTLSVRGLKLYSQTIKA